MDIPKETVLRFQKVFAKDYGKKLSYKEAHEAAYNLIGFFDLLLKIDRRNKGNIKKPQDLK